MPLLKRTCGSFICLGFTATLTFFLTLGAYADVSLVAINQGDSGNGPAKLAPGMISTDKFEELNAVFSPDGQEFYFCRVIDGVYRLFRMNKQPFGSWSDPKRVHLREMDAYEIVDPWITPDGQQMLYISNAPVESFPEGSVNIWVMQREGDEWGVPMVLPKPVNSDGNEIYPMPVNSGNLYFNSTRINRGNDRDIYVSAYDQGKYKEPVNLGLPVSSPYREGDIYVAPDESFLIVTSAKPGGFGRSDLYISYRQDDGTWGETVNLGPKVNSAQYDYTPVVSPDGKYLFFTREGDIYWIPTNSIGIEAGDHRQKRG